jgi:serine/threonine-protein kinase
MDGAASSSAERGDPAVLGRTIAGKFRIDSYVGGGAMGAVYRARQLALDKDVAVKVLHGELARDATFAARFHREARAASKLDHPNSLRVIDFGEEPDGLLYIAMELLEGRDLFHVIREDWPLPAARIAEMLSQALAAIAVAHDMGIVHRDLKPENIMVLRGTDDEGNPRDIVKVCDFGIAKFTEREDRAGGQKLTTHGIVVGTPEYMSPEQGKGEALDARSDLYAMGVILYQLLTGRVPFDAETALGIVLKHVTEDAVPARQLNPAADPRLEAISQRAMKKKREDRYQSARQMRTELRAALGAHTPLAHAATELPPAPASVAHAPTAPAFDSSRLSAAATGSKLTPVGTEALSQQREPSRGRTLAVAFVLVAVGAGAFGAWKLRARFTRPVAAAAMAPPEVTPPAPPTTLKPLPLPKAELPPLEPVAAGSAKPGVASSGASKATAPGPAPATKPTRGDFGAAGGNGPAPASAPAPAPAPASAPAPAPAPAPAGGLEATPTVTPFDASRAHVDWAIVGTGGGATPGAVQRALARRAGSWTQCYRNGLERRHERLEGTALLHLTTDDSGDVVGVRVNGFDAMPGVKSCVAGAARVRIEGVDTGDAWADLQLTFRAE